MARYYVNKNKQSNGDNEVHKLGCSFFPKTNYEYLGDYNYCSAAVVMAISKGYKANGCFYCSKECHTT